MHVAQHVFDEYLPFAWLASSLGNHGLWLAFLLFMGLRGVTLGVMGWRLQRRGGWFAP